MLPFPQIISLQQKYTHHVLDLHDVRSLQQFLLVFICSIYGHLQYHFRMEEVIAKNTFPPLKLTIELQSAVTN